MSAYSTSVESALQRVTTIWTGPVDDADLQEYERTVWADPERAAYDELVDFSRAGPVDVSSDGLRRVADLAVGKDRVDGRARLALVIDGDLQFGLSRMYESLRSVQPSSSRPVRIFHDLGTARAWLDTPREWRGEPETRAEG